MPADKFRQALSASHATAPSLKCVAIFQIRLLRFNSLFYACLDPATGFHFHETCFSGKHHDTGAAVSLLPVIGSRESPVVAEFGSARFFFVFHNRTARFNPARKAFFDMSCFKTHVFQC